MTEVKEKYIPRLQKKFNEEIRTSLKTELEKKNIMEVPKLVKIVLNVGIGDARENANSLKIATNEMMQVSGQKPVTTYAKNAISNFKIRKGDPLGLRVTLREEKMYEFLDRFISVVAPRIRDFSGLPDNNFDHRGNYNFGLKEQIAFPEINYDKVDQIRGMNVTIVTTADNDVDSLALLLALGMPIDLKNKNEEDA